MEDEGRNRCFDLNDVVERTVSEDADTKLSAEVQRHWLGNGAGNREDSKPFGQKRDFLLEQQASQLADLAISASKGEIDFSEDETVQRILTNAQHDEKLDKLIEETNEKLEERLPELALYSNTEEHSQGDVKFTDSEVLLVQNDTQGKEVLDSEKVLTRDYVSRYGNFMDQFLKEQSKITRTPGRSIDEPPPESSSHPEGADHPIKKPLTDWCGTGRQDQQIDPFKNSEKKKL